MGTGGTSLLDAAAKTALQSQSANIIPTVLDIALIVIPVSMAVWALALAIKKGINSLQKKGSKAL